MLPPYLEDLKQFERDMGAHLPEAERILTIASQITASSVDSYNSRKKGTVLMTFGEF